MMPIAPPYPITIKTQKSGERVKVVQITTQSPNAERNRLHLCNYSCKFFKYDPALPVTLDM